MRKGLKMSNSEMHDVFNSWNAGRLQSFLLEVTADIFAYKEPGSTDILLDGIKDQAKSKGTGKWTSQIAMDLVTPVSAIDSAVSMRDLSKYKAERVEAATLYDTQYPGLDVDEDKFLAELEQAYYFAMIVAYAQGMHLLASASAQYGYDLNLESISKIWRGGCIIRSTFLENMMQAYRTNPGLKHLMLSPAVSNLINETQPGIRRVVGAAVAAGIALPTSGTALSYFDAFRSADMPANLIQAQRDYFGAHTFERIGQDGVFHAQWQGEQAKP